MGPKVEQATFKVGKYFVEPTAKPGEWVESYVGEDRRELNVLLIAAPKQPPSAPQILRPS